MGRQSNARAERRALQRAGVAAMQRFVIEKGAFDALDAEAGDDHDAIDLVMHNVDNALRGLVAEGGDVLRHTVVTIGQHPDYPGAVTVEAKVAHKIPGDDGRGAV